MEDKTQLPGVLCSPSDIWKKLARPILLHFHLELVLMGYDHHTTSPPE